MTSTPRWKLVPVEPDDIIVRTIAAALDHPSVFMGGPSQQSLRRATTIYAAALSAAPEPPKDGEVERLREALQGALAEHDFKREQQVMLTEPGWVDKARAALNEGRADG